MNRFIKFKNRNWNLIFGLVLGGMILLTGFVKIYNPDIWFHLQLGKSMWIEKAIPDISTYYFGEVNTDIYPQVRISWLGDIFLYLVHKICGVFGLQLLPVAILALSCLLLLSMVGYRNDGWKLLALVLFVIGTYQLQMVRNAMFGIPLTITVFWLWQRAIYRNRRIWLWAFPPLFGIWSCIHGSYLLGFGVFTLLICGDIADGLRKKRAMTGRLILMYGVVFALSLSAIAFKNPATLYHLNKLTAPFLQADIIASRANAAIVDAVPGIRPNLTNPVVRQIRENGNFVDIIIHRLNNLYVETEKQVVTSSEYLSPFTQLDTPYIWIGLLWAVGGLAILLLFVRPFRFSWFFVVIPVILLGFGYVRITGYIVIVMTCLLFIASDAGELKPVLAPGWGEGPAVLLFLMMCANAALGFPYPIGTQIHIFGIGTAPYFSTACPDRILREYKKPKLFTAINNGGYLLYRWYPEKKVFLDPFFAAHSDFMFKLFKKLHYSDKNGPEILHQKFGITTAVIDQTYGDLNRTFMLNKNWYPRYMDSGMIFYVYHPFFPDSVPLPSLLFHAEAIESLPSYSQKTLSYFSYLIPMSLIRKGRIKDAGDYLNRNATRLQKLAPYIDPAEKQQVFDLLNAFKSAYQSENSLTAYYEWMHREALGRNEIESAIEYGKKVLARDPARLSMALNMAILLYNQNDFNNSRLALNKIMCRNDHCKNFRKENIDKIINLLNKMIQLGANNDLFLSDYVVLRNVANVDPEIVPKSNLFQAGINLYKKAKTKQHYRIAFELLKMIEKDFPANGDLLLEITRHMLSYNAKLSIEPGMIIAYAQKTVDAMKTENDANLSLAYDALAKAYYLSGDMQTGKLYEQKADRER